MKNGNLPIGVCVKVTSLRPIYSDLEHWCSNPRHHLACRNGRVFIGKSDNKHVFAYPSSVWANPYTVKEYGLDKSLELFEIHLTKLLADENMKIKFLELLEYDQIGCFCEPGAKCHRDVILRKLKQMLE